MIKLVYNLSNTYLHLKIRFTVKCPSCTNSQLGSINKRIDSHTQTHSLIHALVTRINCNITSQIASLLHSSLKIKMLCPRHSVATSCTLSRSRCEKVQGATGGQDGRVPQGRVHTPHPLLELIERR